MFCLGHFRSSSCLSTDSCRDFGQAFERMFAVPGESPLLECPLQIQYLFDPAETPYNVTWLEGRNGSEVTEGQPSFVVREQSLWFPNISMEQQGTYTCVVRYEPNSLCLSIMHQTGSLALSVFFIAGINYTKSILKSPAELYSLSEGGLMSSPGVVSAVFLLNIYYWTFLFSELSFTSKSI